MFHGRFSSVIIGEIKRQVWNQLHVGVFFLFVSNSDSLDWKNLSAAEITKRVTEKVKPGSIVLFHNAALHTPEALPGILEKLQGEGYRFVPISELIYKDNYAIDQAGKQYQLSGDSKEAGQA